MTRALWMLTLLGPTLWSPVDARDLTVTPAAAVRSDSIANDDARLTAFGGAVAIAGNVAFVGESRGTGAGVVHIYQRTGTAWRAVGKLNAAESKDRDGFGATLATDGSTLLVGRVDQVFGPDSGRGAVHTFRRQSDGRWAPTGVLVADARLARASFGTAIALSGDMAYVGAPAEGSGVVYVFRRQGDGSWASAGKLPVTESTVSDRFGSAITVDGNRLAVGAPGRSSNKGAIFTYSRAADGAWVQQAIVLSARVADNARLGSSVLLSGRRLVAGAPGALVIPGQGAGSVGMVSLFEYSDVAEIWRERRAFTSFDYSSSRFGQSLGMAGDELWIGAPGSERGTGRIYRVRQTRDGDWLGMQALDVPGVEPGAMFATTFAVSGDQAAIGMPNDGGGEGTVMFLGRTAAGVWGSRGTVFPAATAKTYAAMKGSETMCGSDGKAGEFECGSASLYSFLPISAIGGKRGTNMNDNWGWTDSVTQREIALLGRTDGTSFVDVTDPTNPRYLGDLPKTKGSPASAWRDMKVYKDHVFIVADNAGEHGVQIFDLTRLRKVTTPQVFTPDVTYDRINSAHNIVANEETGYMYTVGTSGGGETCGGGYHMIDVREPKKPKFAGCFGDAKTGRAGTGYSHDAQCVKYRGPDTRYTGKEICIGSNETAISIADLTDKKNPVAISRASYPNVAYAHQAWLTDDHRYLYLNDEGDESAGQGEAAKGTRTMVWDVADLSDPILVKEHVGVQKAIDHNLYVKGDRMYQANYTSGLRILDISDPRNPKEVGFLDTHPGDDGTPQFDGAWSVYPYFKSGTVVVTSIGEGVFFVRDRTRKTVQ